MVPRLSFSCSFLILYLSSLNWVEAGEFAISPDVNVISSTEFSTIEVGPLINYKFNGFDELSFKPQIRLPLTDKEANISQIDRFCVSSREILNISYTFNRNTDSSILYSYISIQGEFGYDEFKYYPSGNKAINKMSSKRSYSIEAKYSLWLAQFLSGAAQFVFQPRLKYSNDWQASEKVGVVNLPNINGVVTTSDMVVGSPLCIPKFSIGGKFKYYPGVGDFLICPSLDWSFLGKNEDNNPFDNIQRCNIELWLQYYPTIVDKPNTQIAIAPFINIRTEGKDELNKFEYGAKVEIKFSKLIID